MKSFFRTQLLLLLFLLNENMYSGNCIPAGTAVTLTRQSEVDSFPINYPDCDVVEGGLTISGNDIANLNGLLGLKIVKGNFEIKDNPILNNLNGLDSFSQCRNNINISNNRQLVNLKGLSSLDTAGTFYIQKNESMVDFIGLHKIKYVASLNVQDNMSLINLHGMEGLEFVDHFYISNNASLINLTGFDSVTQVYQHCFVSDNPSLINLYGLHNLVKAYSSLNFYRNNALINLNGLSSLRSVSSGFVIQENANLIDLTGINRLDTLEGRLTIQLNQSLGNLHGLENLRYMRNGSIQIYGNPSLCSINEINPNLFINRYYSTSINIINNVNLTCCSIIDDLINLNSITVGFYNNAPGCNDITQVRAIANNNCCSTKYTFLRDTICQGESVLFDNKLRTETGNYYDTIINHGTDSVIILQLIVRPTFYQIQTKNLCIGQSFTLSNGRVITTSGIYRDTLQTIFGCDSIIEYRLNFLNNITVNQNPTICKGKTHTLPKGNIVSIAGIYKDTLRASFGCDSIVVTNLTFTNPIPYTNNVTICAGKTFTRPNGNIVSTSGTYYDTIKAPNTCDSVVITNLTVNPYPRSSQISTVCRGKAFVLPSGRSVTQNGTYTDTIQNSFGCDSIVVTNLTVTNPIPFTNTVSICEGQTYILPNGNKVNSAGTYTDTISQTNTCDSVVITNLSVFQNTFNVLLRPADTIEAGNSIELKPFYTNDIATTWTWSPTTNLSCTTCEFPLASPTQTTQYIVNAKASNGCEDTASTSVLVRQVSVYIPSAFSPNGDDVNDVLDVFAINPASFSLKIYNRWSELVFESNDINIKWNGTFKGENCAMDNYAYVLVVTQLNGKQFHEKGIIALLR